MKNYKLAIVGATGLVGKTAIKVLEEKELPISEYIFFASERSAGQKITFKGKDYIVKELTENSFDEHIDFAIFAAGGDTSRKFAPIAKSKNCIVVDNSSAFRMEPDVPLIVPEVNPEEIKKHNGIIANPNCSTIQAVIPLKILDDLYTIKRIVYSTYQAVSGAGQKGVDDLTIPENMENPKKFPYPIINNCIPHIDVFESNGYTKEELKMINETRKILNRPNLKITATAVRVPVLNSRISSATTAKPLPASPALAASIEAFNASRFVIEVIPSMVPVSCFTFSNSCLNSSKTLSTSADSSAILFVVSTTSSNSLELVLACSTDAPIRPTT